MADVTEIAPAITELASVKSRNSTVARILKSLLWIARAIVFFVLWCAALCLLDVYYYTFAGRIGCEALSIGGLLWMPFGLHSLKKASEDQKVPYRRGVKQLFLGAALLLLPTLVSFAHSSGDYPDYVYDGRPSF